MLSRHSGRYLLDSRSVATAEQLAEAIRDKVEDIRITSHIDLSTLPLDTTSDQTRGKRTLPDVVSPIKSIRGDCATAPADAEIQKWNLTGGANMTELPKLAALKPRQCYIICDTDCLTVKAKPVWMDSIFWRFKRTNRSDSSTNESPDTQYPQVIIISTPGELYLSNVTIQGDGQTGRKDATQAFFMPDVSSNLFAEDMTLDNVGGKQTSALDIYGAASFLNGTFRNIKISSGKERAIFYVWQRGKLMLRDAVLLGNAARFDIGKNKNGLVYVQEDERQRIKVKALDVTFNDDLDYDDLAIDVSRAPPGAFKSEDDIFYRELRGKHLLFVSPPANDRGLGTGAIAGIAVAGAVAILAAVAICALMMLMRRRRKNNAREDRHLRSAASSANSKDIERPRRPPSPGRGKSPFSSMAFLSRDGAVRERPGMQDLPDATHSTISTTQGPFTGNTDIHGAPEMKEPGADCTAKERMAWVHWQLDQFDEEHLLLNRFQSLGPVARRQGGQAVVQFARNTLDQREYALKVFAVPHAYQAEAAMYQDESMANFLPRVEAMHDGTEEALVDPSGYKLPPIIIMEKGESLNEWSARAEPDLFMSIAVLANVALRLAEFHAAGYVHRDLKPANVMWLPRENRWTVIDFGCAGRTDAMVPLSFTLVYAAPEVIGALQDGEKKIEADPALDTWALGVMAFELLSGEPAFHVLSDGKEEVVAQLTGEKLLPWEEQGAVAAERLESLGVFKGAVLQLLNRDPSMRPSMQRFYDAANRIFSSRTTIKI